MKLKAALAAVVVFFIAARVWSSGPIGIYGIVERVAIGFGRWPGGVRQSPPSVILPRELRGTEADYRVRPASEKPSSPAPYSTNAGIVKLSDHAGNERIIKHLRDALKR